MEYGRYPAAMIGYVLYALAGNYPTVTLSTNATSRFFSPAHRSSSCNDSAFSFRTHLQLFASSRRGRVGYLTNPKATAHRKGELEGLGWPPVAVAFKLRALNHNCIPFLGCATQPKDRLMDGHGYTKLTLQGGL